MAARGWVGAQINMKREMKRPGFLSAFHYEFCYTHIQDYFHLLALATFSQFTNR